MIWSAQAASDGTALRQHTKRHEYFVKCGGDKRAASMAVKHAAIEAMKRLDAVNWLDAPQVMVGRGNDAHMARVHPIIYGGPLQLFLASNGHVYRYDRAMERYKREYFNFWKRPSGVMTVAHAIDAIAR